MLARLKDRWITKFGLHVATGALSVVAHYSVMGALLHQGSTPVVASSCGFCAGAVLRFLTAYFGVFEPEQAWHKAVPRFIAALAAQSAGNAGLLAALLWAGLPVWWSQVLATGAMTVVNFVMYRVWVFR